MKIEKAPFAVHARRCFGLRFAVGPISRMLLLSLACAVLCGPALAQLNGCPLNSPEGQISHVVYIQFDNVHFERDVPNVPADLEQMPNLLNFLKGNGTFFANHHTPLISHTADDILTSLTGVYPDRHGQAVANSFVIYNQLADYTPPNPMSFWDSFPSSFTYWTNPVSTFPTSDTQYSMITAEGQNAPAPWVPFTRAGCNVGAVSIANLEFENVKGDINNVFGSNSPEATEAKNNNAQAIADFEGIAIHCGLNNPLCLKVQPDGMVHGRADLLPQEPGGYNGFDALYGYKYVVPALIGTNKLNDLFGNLITDQSNPPNTGFPGFGGISPAQTLAYVATMLENGVPIVFSYISDAHDCHTGTPGNGVGCPDRAFRAFGPGEEGYVQQLQAYDKAFGLFFARLKNDGIDPSNTLFIVSADEQDHHVAGPPSPANCDGVNTPCTYTYSSGPNAGKSSIGEIEIDLPSLMNQQFPALVPSVANAPNVWDFHFDMAPAFTLFNFGPTTPQTQDPAIQVDPNFPREFERAVSLLTAVNPITGNTDVLTRYMADHVGLKALHMITGDPQRTPTFVMFADPDYFFEDSNCGAANRATCVVTQNGGFAWNHGGVAPEIYTTWVAMVGPGVKQRGIDRETWSDHVDIRPTMLLLTGLQDDYDSDGRVLVEGLHEKALPHSLRGDGEHDNTFVRLARAYKQINAPVADFGLTSLKVSTKALASDDTGDATYTRLENKIADLTSQRDSLAGKMLQLLHGAEFNGQRIDRHQADKLVEEAERLLDQIHDLNNPDDDHHHGDHEGH